MDASVLQRNNVKILGRGSQPMLFAHGFGCDQNMWRFVTPSFEDRYRIILFDYVGCGKSDPGAYDAARYSRLDGYAEDILDVCRALSLQDVILVGHSVSSMIAALAAIAEPSRFARLIMVGPSPRYIDDDGYVGGFQRRDIEELLDTMERNYIGWANFLAPIVMSNPDRPDLTSELEESFCSTDPNLARRFAEVTFLSDNREDLIKVAVPTLVLQCSEDIIAPRGVGEYVSRHVPGAQFRLLRATGHCPHMSHPEEIVKVITDYLAA